MNHMVIMMMSMLLSSRRLMVGVLVDVVVVGAGVHEANWESQQLPMTQRPLWCMQTTMHR
jgi:hypothetical protein